MKLNDVPIAPASAEELRAEIVSRYETLSKRLKQIARYILDEPNDIALETLNSRGFTTIGERDLTDDE